MKTKTAIISIDNLGTESAPKLSALLKGIPGVETVDFSLERKVAVVEFDPEQTEVDDLLRAVLKEGYHVS
jgi:copper chaperone CopZ